MIEPSLTPAPAVKVFHASAHAQADTCPCRTLTIRPTSAAFLPIDRRYAGPCRREAIGHDLRLVSDSVLQMLEALTRDRQRVMTLAGTS